MDALTPTAHLNTQTQHGTSADAVLQPDLSVALPTGYSGLTGALTEEIRRYQEMLVLVVERSDVETALPDWWGQLEPFFQLQVLHGLDSRRGHLRSFWEGLGTHARIVAAPPAEPKPAQPYPAGRGAGRTQWATGQHLKEFISANLAGHLLEKEPSVIWDMRWEALARCDSEIGQQTERDDHSRMVTRNNKIVPVITKQLERVAAWVRRTPSAEVIARLEGARAPQLWSVVAQNFRDVNADVCAHVFAIFGGEAGTFLAQHPRVDTEEGSRVVLSSYLNYVEGERLRRARASDGLRYGRQTYVNEAKNPWTEDVWSGWASLLKSTPQESAYTRGDEAEWSGDEPQDLVKTRRVVQPAVLAEVLQLAPPRTVLSMARAQSVCQATILALLTSGQDEQNIGTLLLQWIGRRVMLSGPAWSLVFQHASIRPHLREIAEWVVTEEPIGPPPAIIAPFVIVSEKKSGHFQSGSMLSDGGNAWSKVLCDERWKNDPGVVDLGEAFSAGLSVAKGASFYVESVELARISHVMTPIDVAASLFLKNSSKVEYRTAAAKNPRLHSHPLVRPILWQSSALDVMQELCLNTTDQLLFVTITERLLAKAPDVGLSDLKARSIPEGLKLLAGTLRSILVSGTREQKLSAVAVMARWREKGALVEGLIDKAQRRSAKRGTTPTP